MRTREVFLLRLLVDGDAPGAIRGTLQPLAEQRAYSFRSVSGLLALLRELTQRARVPAAREERIAPAGDEGDEQSEPD